MEGAELTGAEGPTVDAGPMVDTDAGDIMGKYNMTKQANKYRQNTKKYEPDNWTVAEDRVYSNIEDLLRNLVGYGSYDYRKSILPFYDDIYKYLDNLQKAKDYEKNTGKSPAYGSSGYTFGNVSNLVGSGSRTVRNAVYAVGNLSKRF